MSYSLNIPRRNHIKTVPSTIFFSFLIAEMNANNYSSYKFTVVVPSKK